MDRQAKAIWGGFAGLLVGLTILLVGVFLGGLLPIIAVGGIIAVVGVASFVVAAFSLEEPADHAS